MADCKAIQIRDQIAAAIASTSYSVFSSRHYALEDADLPAVVVTVGSDSIDQDDLERTLAHEQEFGLHVYASEVGDVDVTVFNTVWSALDALAADPALSGLVVDSYPTEVGEPQREQGKKKMLRCDVVYTVRYLT